VRTQILRTRLTRAAYRKREGRMAVSVTDLRRRHRFRKEARVCKPW